MNVNGDCLKLTTYFGERDRIAGQLVADELLRLYAAEGVSTSILLRGSEGFGRLHHLHTDRLLSLSEDLPVVSIAVDRRERIEALLAPVLALTHRGLLTLERARLLTGRAEPAIASDQPAESLPDATKLTVFLGRGAQVDGRPAFVVICELLHRRGLAGATVLLGVDGTRGGRRARARLVSRNTEVPMMVIAVGAGEQIARVLPELREALDQPRLTLERVRICKRDGNLLAPVPEVWGRDEHGFARWQKLTVYSSQSATHDDRPLNSEIIRRLRGSESAGATSLRGLWGFHGDHPPHGDKLFQLRRHVPVLTITVDTPERTVRAFEIIDELTRDTGLVTSEIVPAMLTISASERQGGLRLASRSEIPGRESG